MTNRAKTAKDNRRRGLATETRVAKLFDGVKVPMSGAGGIKGDVIIPKSYFGSIFVEVKNKSERKGDVPVAIIPLATLTKMEQQSATFNHVGAFLFFHYHNVVRGDYCIMNYPDFTSFAQRRGIRIDVKESYSEKKRFIIPLFMVQPLQHSSDACMIWTVQDKVYAVCHASTMRRILLP